MSKQPEHEGAQRFGGEFRPVRGPNTTGVSLSTFKTLVWVSNVGGLLLVVFAIEFLFVEQKFGLGLGFTTTGLGTGFGFTTGFGTGLGGSTGLTTGLGLGCGFGSGLGIDTGTGLGSRCDSC